MKLFFRFHLNRHIPCVQCDRATFWIICHRRFHYFTLFCRRGLVRQKKCGTYQCCYKFWLWIFLFCNLFFNIFFSKIFSQNFFFIFFQNFFFKIFLSTFFFKILLWQFFFQNLFPTSFQNFFFWGLYSRCLSVYRFKTDCTICICVMKNMIYSKRSKLDFSLVW